MMYSDKLGLKFRDVLVPVDNTVPTIFKTYFSVTVCLPAK